MKTLTAYFSRRGMNYAGGKLVDLKVGNTERAAKLASELAGGALFEIRAEHEYPYDYRECVEVSKEELTSGARPELAVEPGDLSSVEAVILCYPCWCGTMPMPVLRWISRSRSSICACTVTSSAVVGSSAKRMCGFRASAMASTHRWRIPPEK